jgi:dihydrolipoyl dehydrogenase
MDSYDIIVVGGGPGGYVAAIRAAQIGFKTALIEKKHLGGICLNWGCIPTKSLLKGAEVAHTLTEMDKFGFTAKEINFDYKTLLNHSREVSKRLSGGVESLLKKNNVTVIEGEATCVDKCTLSVISNHSESTYKTDHIILATGASPKPIPGIEIDNQQIWNYFDALASEKLPKSILIVGSGAIGLEFASLYQDLGVDVTVIEMLDRIAPALDIDISRSLKGQLEARGISILTDSVIESVEKTPASVLCKIKNSRKGLETLSVDKVLISTGVQGNIQKLGLENVNVETEGSFIKTDKWGRTNAVGLYAIGDVAGTPCLAHKASHDAVTCVEKIAGLIEEDNYTKQHIPACIYCRPQTASVGLTEAEARKSYNNLNIGRFDLSGNGKAIAMGDANGFVKLIFEGTTGELLGAHLIGPEVTELVQSFNIMQTLEGTDEQLINTIFPHPALSESIHEAVLDSLGRAIHK